MMKTFRTDIQQRFADIDRLGHVNNIRLQEYFDLGKMQFYDTVLGGRLDWQAVNLILVSIHTEIGRQTFMDSPLTVETSIEKIGTKSISVYQRLVDENSGLTNAECRSVVVAFDFVSQLSVPIPEEWKRLLEPYTGVR